MSIAGTDLLFVKSENMTENADGGGRMSATFVAAVENDVFPDVAPTERVTGALHLRRLFAGVFSNDNDALGFAQVGMTTRPTDANVDVYLMASLDAVAGSVIDTSSRALAQSALAGAAYYETYTLGTGTMVSGTKTYTADQTPPLVGDKIAAVGAFGSPYAYYWATVTAVSGTTPGSTVTLNQAANWPANNVLNILGYRRTTASGGGVTPVNRNLNLCGLALSTAGVSSAATSMVVDKLTVLVPNADGVATERPLFFAGDRVLIQHASTATREFATLARVSYASGAYTLTFTAGLANAYTTGAKVCLPVDLGSKQAAASGLFSQQTWTRVFGSAAVGTPPTARYSGTVGVTNEGTATDRWAAVFTSSTTFQMISERLGVIGSGNISTDYLPLNAMTGQPYFTLHSAAWGSGWVSGNVFRFDTAAAAGAFWMARNVTPSTAGGTDQATLFMRGDVNA